jgi:diguanylate cyclase (GGDEF)-like protein/PAS domain S-box-containing protein
VNDAATAHYGYSREEFLAMRITDIRPPEEVERLHQTLANRTERREITREWRHLLKDGRTIYVDIVSSELVFAGRPAILVLAQDITERRELDQLLRHQAFHDALTGLANRALFRDRLELAISRRGRANEGFAVMVLDLDNFKAINDTVGHTAGDAVLVEIAGRLQSALRPSDTAARLGGDEFAVLIENVKAEAGALRVVKRIADFLNSPVEVEGETWFMSGSMGVAFSGDGAETVDNTLRNADVAMYDAKKHGRGQFAIFEPAMHEAVLARLALESDLRQAIERDELTLLYQPQVDLKRAQVVGVEALVRWQHPTRGMISPAEFIPLAEESGLIEILDTWVLRQAALQAKHWADLGVEGVAVGVNVSGKEFANPDLAERISATVAAAGVPPSLIELEVTESAAFEMEHARSTLARLRELGFKVAIDDFGVGFSMLGRLQELPIDRLKIDRSFITKVAFGEEEEAPIISGIIAMAHSLRLKVVAEGIETTEQLAFLRRNGCDQGQGYRLGRPMPVADIESMLLRRPVRNEEEG